MLLKKKKVAMSNLLNSDLTTFRSNTTRSDQNTGLSGF